MQKLLLITILGLISTFITAQIPEGYYTGTENQGGDALKTSLYNIIKGHTTYEYTSSSTDVWDILKETDKDSENPDKVIMLYSGRSLNAAQEWNNGNGWTREHVWAKSRGDFGTDEPGVGTDAHNLRPCESSVNSARGNRWFAECTVEYIDNGFATGSYTTNSDADDQWFWKPRDEVKGDVARMIFYMATRYEGENGEPDLEVIDYIPTDKYTNEPVHAKLSDLLQWHKEDPVDEFERNRNEVIYSYQGNRNPFIDHPEWVQCIWEDNCSGFWFTSAPITKTTDRESYTYSIAASGSDNTLSLSAEDIPAWLTFTSNTSATGSATATLSGQAAFSDIGQHTVSIKLSDGTTDIFQNFTITVSDGNPIKFTSTPVVKIDAEQNYSYQITATGDEGAVFYISATAKPDWLSLDNATLPATLSGTPQMSDVGKHAVVLSLTDDQTAKKTITQEFEILVLDPNDVNTVIITQYYESPEGSDKLLEITNIGEESVDLSNYHFGRWSTTGSPSGVYDDGNALSGTMAAGETKVYKHASAEVPSYAVSAAISTTACYINGDDPVALMRNGNTWTDRVDCIYQSTISPRWGEHTSFYRKASVTGGNINESVLDGTGQWVEVTIAEVDNANSNHPAYLGFHGEEPNSIKTLSAFEFKLFPNPVTEILSVKTKERITKVEILSLTGKIIISETDFNYKINVSELNSGVYFIKLYNSTNKQSISKFIKK